MGAWGRVGRGLSVGQVGDASTRPLPGALPERHVPPPLCHPEARSAEGSGWGQCRCGLAPPPRFFVTRHSRMSAGFLKMTGDGKPARPQCAHRRRTSLTSWGHVRHQSAHPERGFSSLVPCGARCHSRAIREANCCRVSQCLSVSTVFMRQCRPSAGTFRCHLKPNMYNVCAHRRWPKPTLLVSVRVSQTVCRTPVFRRHLEPP